MMVYYEGIGFYLDDEILGCGGTMARHIAKGDKVDVCIVTRENCQCFK